MTGGGRAAGLQRHRANRTALVRHLDETTLGQPPYLTDDEIDGICEPLIQSAAQVRYLRTLGMLVDKKPNGRPLVARSEWERARVSTNGADVMPTNAGHPDRGALLLMFQKGKGPHGAQTQK